jgi:hypothetical protein
LTRPILITVPGSRCFLLSKSETKQRDNWLNAKPFQRLSMLGELLHSHSLRHATCQLQKRSVALLL